MVAYKAPDFKERAALAVQAKQKALEQLRAKPAPDEAQIEARRTARLAREAAAEEKRQAKRATEAAAKEAKRAEAASRAAAAAEPARPVRTEAELKAARDARYAARKGRKS